MDAIDLTDSPTIAAKPEPEPEPEPEFIVIEDEDDDEDEEEIDPEMWCKAGPHAISLPCWLLLLAYPLSPRRLGFSLVTLVFRRRLASLLAFASQKRMF